MVSGRDVPWLESRPLPAAEFATVRSRTIFDCCKWDPQVGDVSVLLDTPLVLRRSAADQLRSLAENLAVETLAAEEEIRSKTSLQAELGLPWSIRRALRHASSHPAAKGPRLMRFDFHWTTEGWRITEVNSDVPGGYIEASGFTRLMASACGYNLPLGDPATDFAQGACRWGGKGATVGLVHATAYVDDRQVMEFLRRRFAETGLHAMLLSPADVRWREGLAEGHDGDAWRKLDLVFRFFPAEWLPSLGWTKPWRHFFYGSRTPLLNPGSTLLTQSKRFPLVWARLRTDLTTWRKYLPETIDPRVVPGNGREEWVLKPALGRVGDGVDVPSATAAAERAKIRQEAQRWPSYWSAQRRFEAVSWETERGALFPALGVFVIDGRAAGIYARAARRPLIDAESHDVAVLLEPPAQTGDL